MSKKDYKKLIEIVKELRDGLTPFDSKTSNAIHTLERSICVWLEQNDPKFDSQGFLEASK